MIERRERVIERGEKESGRITEWRNKKRNENNK